MGRNRAPSCWIASQADLNSGLLERVVQALHNPRSKRPHPKLLDLSVGSATADRRKATVTDCNRSISASSIGESWKSRCAPFDFRAMLDIITILSAAGLQQELKSVNGDKSLVIREDLRIENCRSFQTLCRNNLREGAGFITPTLAPMISQWLQCCALDALVCAVAV